MKLETSIEVEDSKGIGSLHIELMETTTEDGRKVVITQSFSSPSWYLEIDGKRRLVVNYMPAVDAAIQEALRRMNEEGDQDGT